MKHMFQTPSELDHIYCMCTFKRTRSLHEWWMCSRNVAIFIFIASFWIAFLSLSSEKTKGNKRVLPGANKEGRVFHIHALKKCLDPQKTHRVLKIFSNLGITCTFKVKLVGGDKTAVLDLQFRYCVGLSGEMEMVRRGTKGTANLTIRFSKHLTNNAPCPYIQNVLYDIILSVYIHVASDLYIVQ